MKSSTVDTQPISCTGSRFVSLNPPLTASSPETFLVLRKQAIRLVFFSALWLLALGPAIAQMYASGVHEIASPDGDIRVTSGFVSHLGPHAFHVYTFMFRPIGDATWHQVPIVESPAEPELRFVVPRTATADFTTADALVVSDTAGIVLLVARLQYARTPYDDDAHVRTTFYRLTHLEDERRWILQEDHAVAAASGRSVEQVLESMRNHGDR